MDAIAAEIQGDAREAEEFRKASAAERAFLCWRQFFDVKKYCILAFLLALILAIQLVAMFAPMVRPEDLQGGKDVLVSTWKKYFGGNETDKVVQVCMVAERSEENRTEDLSVEE